MSTTIWQRVLPAQTAAGLRGLATAGAKASEPQACAHQGRAAARRAIGPVGPLSARPVVGNSRAFRTLARREAAGGPTKSGGGGGGGKENWRVGGGGTLCPSCIKKNEEVQMKPELIGELPDVCVPRPCRSAPSNAVPASCSAALPAAT